MKLKDEEAGVTIVSFTVHTTTRSHPEALGKDSSPFKYMLSFAGRDSRYQTGISSSEVIGMTSNLPMIV